MDEQLRSGTAGDPSSWRWAMPPDPAVKYDNRAYLAATHAAWAESANGPIAPTGYTEAQPVPAAYAGGYLDLI